MERGLVVLALLAMSIGISSSTIAQRPAVDFDPAFGGSRDRAMRLEEMDYDAKCEAIYAKRVRNKAELDKSSGDYNSARAKWLQKEKEINAEAIDAKAQYDIHRDTIGRYWDRVRKDIANSNKVDGRDGQRYADKVPKPALEPRYPTRMSKGSMQVLYNGHWVAAKRSAARTGGYVPANP